MRACLHVQVYVPVEATDRIAKGDPPDSSFSFLNYALLEEFEALFLCKEHFRAATKAIENVPLSLNICLVLNILVAR